MVMFTPSIRCSLFLSLFSLLFLGLTLPARSVLADVGEVRVGGTVSILPVGELHAEVEDFGSETVDAVTAFGLGGVIEVQILTHLAVGFMPRLLLNVKPEDEDGGSAEELDLLLRLTGFVPVGDTVQLYAFAAPGYSVLFIPDWPGELSNPTGFIFGLGGGTAVDINPRLRLTAELGYQFGNQGLTEQGRSVELETSYLHVGMSAMARF